MARKTLTLISLVTILASAGLFPSAPAGATFPGQGKWVLFTRLTNSNGYDVRSVQPNTGALKSLTSDKKSYPGAYSSNGKKIVFTSLRGHDVDGEIYVADANGSDPVRITHDSKPEDYPAWSPSGKRILFVDHNSGIWSIKTTGTGRKHLYSNGGATLFPAAYSPNGSQIAFSVDTQTATELDVFTMNADGSNVFDVTPWAGDQIFGDWSPNGSVITYSAQDAQPVYQIYTVLPNGTGNTQLTFDTTDKLFPAYTADGTHILFEATGSSGGVNIEWMLSNGTNVAQVTTPASNRYDLLQFVL